MLAAIYDPYLDTLGGGERYSLTFATALKKFGFTIDVFWDDPEIRSKLEARFGFDLSGINFLPNIFSSRNILGTSNYLRGYDLVFFLSDGSVPYLTGRKNILHFQVPFKNIGGKSLINKFKLRTIHTVLCNSNFTKSFIDKEFGIDSKVLYPPIETDRFKPGKKENMILTIGRFSRLLQLKRQDLLMDTFIKIYKKDLPGWRMAMAGGTDIGGKGFVNELKKRASGHPIEIFENPGFDSIKQLYAKSKLFWFASGFGVDEEKDPRKVEHFGISVAEAMSAGCIPFVHPKGGVREIVKDNKNGFYWNSLEELVTLTKKVTSKNKYQEISDNAIQRANDFSVSVFEDQIQKLI